MNKGYEDVFNNCKIISNNTNDDYTNFREKKEFEFLINNNPEPDYEALTIGKSINNDLFEEYLNIKKSNLGYGNTVKFSKLDNLDSRHYMMSCFVYNYFKQNNISLTNILEIGGGFGNWSYINENIMKYKKWTIIDLDFVIKLQKWFLEKELIDINKINFIDTKNISKIINDEETYDITICAHSLSEISKENFDSYLLNILIKKTKYIFYAYHTRLPNINLINYKKNMLDNYFDIKCSFLSENENVNNILYSIK
jgi:hypothetical protein